MPGLVGFTDKYCRYNKNMLLNMRDLLKHFDWYIDEEPYSDKQVYASRTHLGIVDQGKQPYIFDGGIFSWINGEFYNQGELKAKYNVISETDNELLSDIYHSTRSFEFLKDVDGYYAAVIYDKQESTVHLITDRYGFKPLYWGLINGDLVWSSELKGFLGHADFKPVIDRAAVEDFFDIGHLLENRTWFEGVELVSPASVLTFDLEKSKVEIRHYWSWSEIKPIKDSIDEREIAEELGKLFKGSVRKRVNNNERIGITLSGGLDSRAIIAAFPEDYKPLHTFTFGQKGCADIKISQKVSEVKGATHHIFELNSSNWLIPRISGVWKSDGELNLLHMHGVELYEEFRPYINFNLSGVFGGEIIGGQLCTIDNTMEYKVRNQGRRFQNAATKMAESWIIFRRVFFDNNLSEFIFSIPEKQTLSVYKKMLLGAFPEYFNTIPWQGNTGVPISYPSQLVKLLTFKNRVVNKLKRESRRFGFNFKDLNNYTDYPAWIRKDPAKSFFKRALLNKNALYPEYVDRNKIQEYVSNHMGEKANYHNELCLVLTFELWLQQVFEGKYRE